ncbi:type I restriction enzyme, S subunit [Stutzerimonas kunmingensis]|uniref:restriction endonuclease subunit S n=1 Tax=Stutzerimonas kunmingensis TaxID=1211807 RepID=UPI0008E97064|nr:MULTISPECIES: restriction endonuclease subunit S [Stutzerimonas stutzeri group]MCQ2044265.1 restriction endonuclease subunit S [Stutzerimonas kunmingensis]SFJ93687.1 type I restriction enzyme, S subunit [Stutzerimonas kunmingensis]HBW10157.1 restriction endonuclease subunit S [Pseudomonas sp.]
MSHYKPYPAYKDSGVEWLDAIPDNWEISRLGFEAWVRARLGWKGLKAEEYVDDGYAFLSTPDIKGTEIDFSDVNFITEERYEESPEIKLAVGDVLLAKDGSTLGTVNVVRKLPRAATVNSSIAVITPFQRLTPLYLYYLFKCSYLENTIQVLKGGMGVPHLFQWDINKFKIPLPGMLEQAEIAAHLDLETARIDALIEKKTRFIELLREKRQALITHAVTKGLDPNVKMKDSGVEWLGEVPEHWEALPLRRVVTAVKTGGTPSEEQPAPDADGLAWYTPGDFGSSLVLTSSEKRVSALAVSTGEAKVYPAGSVLVVSIGATLGKVGYIADPASANQQINAVIPSSRVNGYFLAYSLSVKTEAMWFLANAATIGIMNQEKTKEIWLAVPSQVEQETITQYLDKGTGRLDSLIGKTERSIELLKERRSALITAAVTGQIDLREAV